MMDSDQTDRGSSRRELLKRGAVVGGTLLWATPLIQSVDLRAAAAQAGTEQPTPTSADDNRTQTIDTTTTLPEDRPPFALAGGAITRLDLLLVFEGELYAVHYEPFGDGGAFVAIDDTLDAAADRCIPATGWLPATKKLLEGLNVRGSVQTAGTGDERQYVVFLPSDITLFAAFSKCAQRCSPPEPWRGGFVFSPCPPGPEEAAPGPTTTTTTTTSTTTSTTAPPG